MKIKYLLLILISLTILNSCGILYNKKIECRKYVYSDEEYWSPYVEGNLLVYVNSKNETKEFYIEKKEINHTLGYKTDTGCSCLDESHYVLKGKNDFIAFSLFNNYIQNSIDVKTEYILFEIDNKQSIFDEKHMRYEDEIKINDKILKDVKIYEKENTGSVVRLILAKGIGLIEFELEDGEKWTIKTIKNPKNNFQFTFKYLEKNCEFKGRKTYNLNINTK